MRWVKHTPGPWFEQTGFSDDVEITAESREGMVAICSMDLGFTGHIGVEQEANARLIAAAPCTFEALEQLLGNAEIARFHLKDTEEGMIVGSALFDTINQARAALARARGEQDGGGED